MYYEAGDFAETADNETLVLHGCEINVLNGGRLSLQQEYINIEGKRK